MAKPNKVFTIESLDSFADPELVELLGSRSHIRTAEFYVVAPTKVAAREALLTLGKKIPSARIHDFSNTAVGQALVEAGATTRAGDLFVMPLDSGEGDPILLLLPATAEEIAADATAQLRTGYRMVGRLRRKAGVTSADVSADLLER